MARTIDPKRQEIDSLITEALSTTDINNAITIWEEVLEVVDDADQLPEPTRRRYQTWAEKELERMMQLKIRSSAAYDKKRSANRRAYERWKGRRAAEAIAPRGRPSPQSYRLDDDVWASCIDFRGALKVWQIYFPKGAATSPDGLKQIWVVISPTLDDAIAHAHNANSMPATEDKLHVLTKFIEGHIDAPKKLDRDRVQRYCGFYYLNGRCYSSYHSAHSALSKQKALRETAELLALAEKKPLDA